MVNSSVGQKREHDAKPSLKIRIASNFLSQISICIGILGGYLATLIIFIPVGILSPNPQATVYSYATVLVVWVILAFLIWIKIGIPVEIKIGKKLGLETTEDGILPYGLLT